MTAAQRVVESANWWGGWSHQNSKLELAVYALEMQKAGLDITPLSTLWELQEKHCKKSEGVYLRAPLGEPHSDMTTSHDEWLGIAALSFLFDHGKTASAILDKGLNCLGLWYTNPQPQGKWLDSEWFTSWRPEYRAIMKLAARRKINLLEHLALILNLRYSKVYNMKRVRLLLLELMGYNVDSYHKLVGDKHKEYHSSNKILQQEVWNQDDNKT